MSTGLDPSMRDEIYMAPTPEGQVRDLINPPYNGYQMNITGGITCTIAAIAVALRIYGKMSITKKKLGVDDYLIMLALVFSVAETISVALYLGRVCFGLHWWYVKVSDYSPGILVASTFGTLVYAFSVIVCKLSILTFYLQLSPERNFRIITFTLIGITASYAMAYLMLSIFGCRPVLSSWYLDVPIEFCVDRLQVYTALGVMNILMDFAILFLPLRIVWGLRMPRRQKVSVVLLLSTGLFVCVCAIKRQLLIPPLLASRDYSWEAPEQMFWCYLEANGGILCACIPTLKPVAVRWLPVLVGTVKSSRDDGNSAPGSFALNTVMQRNKDRRAGKSDGSRGPSGSKANDDDLSDEDQKLWYCNGYKLDNRTVVEGRGTDTGSVSNSDDGKAHHIHVTKETSVTYGV